jgi:hypothetical protein
VITIENEPFSPALYAEILPLAQACWNESTIVKNKTCAYYGEREFAVEPDLDLYERLASAGSMIVLALREDETLKGYVVGYTYRSPHHQKILCGHGDSIYIEPAYRSYAVVMAEKFESAMKALKVQAIGWPTHIDGPMYEVLKNLGYVGDDIVMEKRLCV